MGSNPQTTRFFFFRFFLDTSERSIFVHYQLQIVFTHEIAQIIVALIRNGKWFNNVEKSKGNAETPKLLLNSSILIVTTDWNEQQSF